jgi:predicted metalloprotease
VYLVQGISTCGWLYGISPYPSPGGGGGGAVVVVMVEVVVVVVMAVVVRFHTLEILHPRQTPTYPRARSSAIAFSPLPQRQISGTTLISDTPRNR